MESAAPVREKAVRFIEEQNGLCALRFLESGGDPFFRIAHEAIQQIARVLYDKGASGLARKVPHIFRLSRAGRAEQENVQRARRILFLERIPDGIEAFDALVHE